MGDHAMTPEGEVKELARKAYKRLGIYYFPVNQQGIGRRGIPDDLLCLQGRMWFVEYKAHMRWETNNKAAIRTLPTVLQILEMQKARDSGAVTVAIDDHNVNAFIQYLHDNVNELHMMYPEQFAWEIELDMFERYRNAEPAQAFKLLVWNGCNGEKLYVPRILENEQPFSL